MGSGAAFQIPGLDLATLMEQAARFLFAMLRIGAFLFASPAFGGRWVPLPVRIIATVCLTLPVAGHPALPDAEAITRLSAAPAIVAEIAVGLTAGLVLTILFAAASIAGDRIANTAGLGFAAQIDPAAGGQTPIVSQLFGLALLMVFLGLDGHLAAIRIVLDSYDAFPPGATPAPAALAAAGIAAGGRMFALSVSVMLPVVSLLLLVNIVIGVLTRSAPQLNIFSFGFPLTMAATFLLLWLTTPETGLSLRAVTEVSLDQIADLLPRSS